MALRDRDDYTICALRLSNTCIFLMICRVRTTLILQKPDFAVQLCGSARYRMFG